jgi:catechol 2,3-dioxygenase-like lactoylglutathione lyase family enzyme
VSGFSRTGSARKYAAILCLLGVCGSTVLAQTSPGGIAPAGADVPAVWHLGRVTGDLERIIAFYHDLLGLGLRGARNQPRVFTSNTMNNEFVNAPAHAEYRAAFMPIPGASAATEPQNQIYLEAFEYRNIDRRQIIPALTSPGVSSLRVLVRDLDRVAEAAKAAGVAIITTGGVPVAVPVPAGLTGSARAIMIRDPDGYPVELMQVTPAPSSVAPDTSNVLGAQMTVVVTDLAASLDFYRRFVGPDLQAWEGNGWQANKAFSQLRSIADAEYRTAAVLLPGSAIRLELIQFRGVEQAPYRPVFQDIGFGHVALVARDIEVMLSRMKQLGVRTIAQSGTYTQFNPTLRAIYTRDLDGFFIEVIERR